MNHEPRIYFLKSTRSNAIKIGTSADVAQRVRALQSQSFAKLTLLAEIPGDERYEHVLHAHFAEYRIKGEWFKCVGRLAAFVGLLPSLPAHVRPPSPRRAEQQKPKTGYINKKAVRELWQKQLSLIASAVREYGVEKFANLVDARSSRIEDALLERNSRRWPAEWTHVLTRVTTRERAHAIVDCGWEMTSWRLDFDTWQSVEDPERAEQARLRFFTPPDSAA